MKSANIKINVTIQKGSVLECDRVYIRTFSKSAIKIEKDFDSTTWRVIKNGKSAPHQRFWAKLADCCDIEYELQADSLYRNRVKLIKAIHEV